MLKVSTILVFGFVAVYAGSISQQASDDGEIMRWLEERNKVFEERFNKFEEKGINVYC
jgi:ABC-type glycerol-3-phosphate transport system substrate-binding protein